MLLASDRAVVVKIIQGGILSVCVPLVWLLFQWYQNVDLKFEVTYNQGLYIYMLVSSLTAVTLYAFCLHYNNNILDFISVYDELTGIYNYRYFQARLDEEWSRSQRTKSFLSVIIFDLDSFSRINETYGKPAGDRFITEVGTSVRYSMRTGEVVSRVHGEEFAVLLPNCDLKQAKQIAERLRKHISQISIPVGAHADLKVTASFGIAVSSLVIEKNTMIDQAYSAMKLSKSQGKDRISVY